MKLKTFCKTLVFTSLFLVSACAANKENKNSKYHPETEKVKTGENETEVQKNPGDSAEKNGGKIISTEKLSAEETIKVTVRLSKYRSHYLPEKKKNKKSGKKDALAQFQVISPTKYKGRMIKIHFVNPSRKNVDKKYKVGNDIFKPFSFKVPQKYLATNQEIIEDSQVKEFYCGDQEVETKFFPGLMMVRLRYLSKSAPQHIDPDSDNSRHPWLKKNERACNPEIEILKKSYCSCRRNSDCTKIIKQVKFNGGYCGTCGTWPINKKGARSLKSFLSKKRPKRCPKYSCAPPVKTVPKCKKGTCVVSPVN
ncbi:MAG: hypothetical protein ACQES9_08000 [Myxococcota bacterium]